MRIATWNINGLRARLEFVKAWLRERKPDLVGLQELKMTDDLFPHQAFAELGYRAYTHGQKSWNGVAILSRHEARIVQQGLPGQEAFGARLLTAEVAGLSFTCLYCPNGKNREHVDFSRKLAWFDALAEHLAETGANTKSALLGGDFNICPTGLDSWNEQQMAGEIFHTDEERRRIRVLSDAGWCDLYRQLQPDRQAFSWWDYRGGAFHRKQGLRIDFLMGTQKVVERLRSVEIDRDWRKKRDGLTPSDHAPVWADLSL